MFDKLLQWLKGVIDKMLGKSSIKQAMQVDIAISPKMADAITLWSLMYENKAPWLSAEDVYSLNLPAAIAGEIARSVTIEMKVELSGSERAKYLQGELDRVLDKVRQQVEYGVAKGGLMIKPYIDGDHIAVDFIHADQFYPVSFDADGDITACIFADRRQRGDKYYTRLEYHEMQGNACLIRNKAFRSDTKDALGQEVPLASIDDWASLLPEATITNIERPLFAYFRYPLANNIDPSSPLGVSCYSRAVDLIRQADEHWSGFLWEFDSAKRALYVDVLAFGKDKNNKPVIPNKRLYRTIDAGGADDALFKEWSPTIRQEDYLRGLNAILKRIEYLTGLAYGTLSDPEQIDKTATEIRASKQRSAATITDTQKALRTALDQLLYAMDVWATIGRLAPRGTYEAVYQFDDSIVVDTEQQFRQDLQLVSTGIMSKVEWRMRNFHESEAVAREKIAAVQAEQPEDLFSGASA